MMMGLELLIGAAVVAYVLGWRPQRRRPTDPATAESPLDILKARYARGEISYDEFEQAREALRPRGYTGQTMRLEDEFEQAREVRR